MDLPATYLLYLEDTYQASAQAHVIACIREDDDRYALVLNQTIFYPQGGGQPYDTGVVYNDSGTFRVEEVWLRDGVVHHIGHYEYGELSGEVTMNIDMQRRYMNARLHTCGHLIDYAMQDIGCADWKPTKGYHFPDGAYVQYQPGESIVLSDYPDIADHIERALNARIEAGGAVTTAFVSRDELSDYVTHVPPYIPEDKPCRIVIYDNSGMPCGGTHVRDVHEIGQARIRGVKKKKGEIKIAYELVQ